MKQVFQEDLLVQTNMTW